MTDDKDYWTSLDRRVTELDNKFASLQRDYDRDVDQLTHKNEEVTNRVNRGLSPSVQKAIQDTADAKLLIKDLDFLIKNIAADMKNVFGETIELTRKMHDNLRENNTLILKNFDQDRLRPVESEVGFIKKTFIYGLVGAGIVFIGQKTMNFAWDKIEAWRQPPAVTTVVMPKKKN